MNVLYIAASSNLILAVFGQQQPLFLIKQYYQIMACLLAEHDCAVLYKQDIRCQRQLLCLLHVNGLSQASGQTTNSQMSLEDIENLPSEMIYTMAIDFLNSCLSAIKQTNKNELRMQRIRLTRMRESVGNSQVSASPDNLAVGTFNYAESCDPDVDPLHSASFVGSQYEVDRNTSVASCNLNLSRDSLIVSPDELPVETTITVSCDSNTKQYGMQDLQTLARAVLCSAAAGRESTLNATADRNPQDERSPCISALYKENPDQVYPNNNMPASPCEIAIKQENIFIEEVDDVDQNGEKPYKCSVCEYRCTQRNNLIKHVRIHTGEKPYMCSFCTKSFSQTSARNEHMKTHSGEKPYQCSLCEKMFSRKHTLDRHMNTHTGEKSAQCAVCNLRLSSIDSLRNHMKAHTGEKPFACMLCSFRCVRKSGLDEHIRRHTGEKPYQCSLCDYRSVSRKGLSQHTRTHHRQNSTALLEDKNPESPDLNKQSSSNPARNKLSVEMGEGRSSSQINSGTAPSSVNPHEQDRTIGLNPILCSSSERKNFTDKISQSCKSIHLCQVCGKRLASKSSLEIHMRSHTGEKPYKCTVCERRYAQKSALNDHMNTHTGVKPFVCSVCEKKFTRKSDLNDHMWTHTGHRSIVCTLCRKRVRTKFVLKQHMRTHSSEKPFQCPECDYRSRIKWSMTLHMRLHTGEKPYKCTVCERQYRLKFVLNEHMRIHTGERPFMCTVCGKTFVRKRVFDKHMRIHRPT